jgi:hypothetical protein
MKKLRGFLSVSVCPCSNNDCIGGVDCNSSNRMNAEKGLQDKSRDGGNPED